MKTMMIIGGGVSGIYLSIRLKELCSKDLDVIVLEANSTPLKKLLATGNGRCNLSNKDLDAKHYEGQRSHQIDEMIQSFDIVQRLEEEGLYTKYMGSLLYPTSEQASSVKTILLDRATQLGVTILTEQEVKHVEKDEDRYVIKTAENDYHADYVTLAMGTAAGKLSTECSRENILSALPLSFQPFVPSLTQMMTHPAIRSLKGVRMKGIFTLMFNETILAQEEGEMLFTDYGVSGIAIMQLSRYYEEGCTLHCDFFPQYSQEQMEEIINKTANQAHPYDGLINGHLARFFEKCNQNPLTLLKDYTLKIKGIRGSAYAQVMKGGISMSNLNDDFGFKDYPGLYACGELLDVTGDCGGYNLHFSFASADAIARGIERTIHVKNQ